MGLVSVISAKEIVKVLDLPLVGIIKSDAFAPSAVVCNHKMSYELNMTIIPITERF